MRVEFVARHDLEGMLLKEFNTPRGVARYSTPEVTALELVGYPNHAGGIANVATVLSDLVEEMEADALARAARLSPVSWSQRLGYLLERVGESDVAEALVPFVEEHARSYTPLRRAAPNTGAARDASWKLIVNVIRGRARGSFAPAAFQPKRPIKAGARYSKLRSEGFSSHGMFGRRALRAESLRIRNW